MRMNLSVVMRIVDQMRAPLQAITQNTNRYTEQIQALQESQADTSSQMAMIQSLKRTREQMALNNVNINAATERLARLEAQAAETTEPSAQLTAQIATQRERLQRLTTQQNTYSNNLNRLNDRLGEAGVNVENLDDEFSRLNDTYNEQSQRLNQVSQRYQQILRRLRPLQNIANRIRLPTLDNAKSLVAASAAPLASIGALGYVINDTANEINALSKAAKEVNMPVETMQALMLQATDAGAEADDMASAIREMALRWGEMKTLRSGAMNDYFKETNNKAAYRALMNAKNEQEAYQVLIDEIAKETDVSKRNFMMDEFFGGDSEKLIGVLSAGTKGLEDARKKLESIGGAVTQEEVDSAESYKTSLKDLLSIINNVKFKVLTPIIQRLSETFKRFAESFKNAEWREDVIKKVSDVMLTTYNVVVKLSKAVMVMAKYWKEILAGLALLKIGFIALNAVMLANPISWIVAGIAAAGVAITYLISKFVGFGNIFKWVSDKWTALKNYFSETLTSIIDAFKNIKNSITNAIGSFNPFGFISSWSEFIGNAIQSIIEKFVGIKDKLAGVTSGIVDKVSSLNPFESIKNWSTSFGETFTNIQDKFIGIKESIVSKISEFNPFQFIKSWIGFVSNTITSLIDKFIGIKERIQAYIPVFNPFSFLIDGIKTVGDAVYNFLSQFTLFRTIIDNIKAAFVKFISIIPQRLLPDSWKENIDKLKAELSNVNDVNASADVNNTNINENRTITSFEPFKIEKYSPLTTHQLQSKSEVSLRIQSDKPVTIEKAKSDKATELDLDVGNMQFSY